MRALPLTIGTIHFIGIGGIGMSGIAEVLHNLGYAVQGSDLSESANVKRLIAKGIAVKVGHRAENLGEAAVVVYSSAVKPDNPEIVAARARLLPIVRRAEMLGELMRLKWSIAVGGTHGKTTTTTMIASVIEAAGLDPTAIIGGIVNAYGTNARLGSGEWLVVEADESAGTFVKLPATIAIPKVADRKIITYGMSPQADVRAVEIKLSPAGARYDVIINDRTRGDGRTLADMRLPMVGEHNVQNSLAAIAVAHEMGIDEAVLRRALAGFDGVKRRFTKTGEVGGVTIIDDYGHHPVEIAATLKAARGACPSGQVIAVVQPHRYTRLKHLFEEFCTCFNDADCVVVADVYAAGEQPIEGANRDALVEGLRARGHRHVLALAGSEALAPLVVETARPGDLVVCLGAGSITYWANALPQELQRLMPQTREAAS